ncbi:MAG: hypothetical protein KC996_11855 [Phycisphaerales bacterium]|nr:hypothetical protein [Phycisphaerales bacterium]
MHDEHDRPLIGPVIDHDGPDTQSSMLIDEARERLRLEDERNTEGKRLARRLFIAFALIALLGVVFYIVLPHYGVHMPAILPLLCFGAILVGTVLSARDEAMSNAPNGCACTDDDGRPIGCCQGPRPLNAFRQPKKK